MKMKKILSLLILFGILASCSDDNKNASEKTGRLSVTLTDAPFPYDLVAEANVTIFKIEARLKSDDESAMDNSDDDLEGESGSEFILLMEDEIDVNLLELTNGVTTQMADIEVPAGTYDLVRVYVRGTNVVLTDGRVFDLKVPSGEQTGIKVFIKPGLTVTGGLSSDLLLDFDVSKSFVAKGNIKRVDGINGFNFKPVIKASNMSTAGSLIGNVSTIMEEMSTPLEGSQVSVIAADTINTTAFTDVDGNYMIMGLQGGMYKAVAEFEGYVASDTVNIEINVANNTVQDFLLEQKAEEDN